MPKSKTSRSHKKKKKSKKRKRSQSVEETEHIKRHQLSSSSTAIPLTYELHSVHPVKKEVTYPDTRFKNSTTLFPAGITEENALLSERSTLTVKRRSKDELASTTAIPVKAMTRNLDKADTTLQGNGNDHIKVEVNADKSEIKTDAVIKALEKRLPSEISGVTFKRRDENKLASTSNPKKKRKSNSAETLKSETSDDCVIVEKPIKRVKVEVIDLTDESCPVVPILCTPVNTVFFQKRQPDKLAANGGIRIKVEPMKETWENNSNTVTVHSNGTDNYSSTFELSKIIQPKVEKNKSDKDNNGINIDKLNVGDNKNQANNYPPVNNMTGIQIKTEIEQNRSNNKENIDVVHVSNKNQATIGNIDAVHVSNKNQATIDNNKNQANNYPPVNNMTGIHIKTEIEQNRSNNEANTDVVHVSNKNQATIGNSDHQIQIKSEQDETNENISVQQIGVLNNISVSSNESPSGVGPSITSLSSDATAKVDTHLSVPSFPGVCYFENMSDLRFGTECLTNAVHDQQPKKKVKNYESNNSILNAEAQEKMICVKIEKCTDSSAENLSSIALIKTEPDPQSYEAVTFPTPLLKYFNCNSKIDLAEVHQVLTYLNKKR